MNRIFADIPSSYLDDLLFPDIVIALSSSYISINDVFSSIFKKNDHNNINCYDDKDDEYYIYTAQ